jgi:hypothetical protein
MTLGALESIVVGFDHPDFRGAIADEIGRVIDAGIVRAGPGGVLHDCDGVGALIRCLAQPLNDERRET